ncbi:hypothetical protein DFA_06709 [Cavenderia fasciculata]|uniref:Uncharacterized protein n=1 Tax=Cavenderia fasciculata TaxID=261658 RepID=F4Q222_CACFS|nr:uncharacterized protein DFA_06709 [Cavenderia fasciculata]EGG18042.1 hypothetical protein DFA_06709 [Cavenderia fasciculata]|eukprot:XP_004356935.1 hypothetical protein DFA_06709 [Cavenderia fasciculata]
MVTLPRRLDESDQLGDCSLGVNLALLALVQASSVGKAELVATDNTFYSVVVSGSSNGVTTSGLVINIIESDYNKHRMSLDRNYKSNLSGLYLIDCVCFERFIKIIYSMLTSTNLIPDPSLFTNNVHRLKHSIILID